MVTHQDRNAGFCASITYALNGVRRALELDRLPVVLLDEESSPQFFDAERGPNVWEYYFEPVMRISYGEFEERRAREGWSVHRFDFHETLYHHLRDPERIATFWAYEPPADPEAWMAEKRALGRTFVARFVRPLPIFRRRAEAFFREHLANEYVVGAHVRGTDFAYAEATEPEQYVEGIRQHVAEREIERYKVFLATDQQQFVELFRRELGERVVVADGLRSEGEVAPFNLPIERSRALLGEDVLLDVLLLARSDYLFKGASAVGEYALWFAPQLECTDFALSSRFRERQVDLLQPAYHRLNVAGRRGPLLWLSRLWLRMEWPRRVVLALSRFKGWLLSLRERNATAGKEES
ncbi:MAG: hypothetical protein R3244_01235 [Thermoanaerobaculia bacterium]|nr:hypothetical protein [Thermoanaerobaculia bacterium]